MSCYLRNRRRKPEPPKTFQIKFGKMVSLFRREIVFPSELLSGHQKEIVSGGRKDVSSNTDDWNFGFHHDVFCRRCGRMVSKDHVYQTQPVYTHPEMFDENGNILPDEILAVRFENDYDEFDEEDDN